MYVTGSFAYSNVLLVLLLSNSLKLSILCNFVSHEYVIKHLLWRCRFVKRKRFNIIPAGDFSGYDVSVLTVIVISYDLLRYY